MRILVAAAMVLASAGQTSADDCETMVKKSEPVMDQLSKAAGVPWDDAARKRSVEDCRYQSDGKTVTATAVGDVECDGKPDNYTLTMSLDKSLLPTNVKLVAPTLEAPAAKKH
jgi:hypothetical protein